MRPGSSLSVSLPLVAVLAGPATANEAVRPLFATLDNTAEPSQVTAGAALTIVDNVDGSFFRSDVLAQFVLRSGVGAYAAVATSSLVFEPADEEGTDDLGGDGTDVNALQLGALYQIGVAARWDLGFRVAVVLPTATGSKQGADLIGSLVNHVTTAGMRPAELATIFPDTTWLRLGASSTYHHGKVFVRADLGFDVAVVDTEGVDPFFHGNLGVGFAQSAIIATLELQNVYCPADEEHDFDGGRFHTGAIALRYRAGRITPVAVLSFPLDDEALGEIVFASLGISALL